jgi:uncharacterized protein (TIGR00251 family)
MKKEGSRIAEKILDIWVQPRARRNEILGYHDESLRVRVTGAPTEGEANRLCRKVLAAALKIPPSRVEILSGHGARRKRVRVKGVDAALWQKFGEERKDGDR